MITHDAWSKIKHSTAAHPWTISYTLTSNLISNPNTLHPKHFCAILSQNEQPIKKMSWSSLGHLYRDIEKVKAISSILPEQISFNLTHF